MLKTIFLDLDDTILDFRGGEAHALSRALRRNGIEPDTAILERYHIINMRQWELLEEGKLTREQVLVSRFQILFGEMGIARSGKEVCDLYESYLAEEHGFVPGAVELLEGLSARYDLYAASNGAAVVQRRRLADADIGRYFKGIFISEEMGADKPSTAFFERCFAAIPDFCGETALIVGDSLTSDIRGGINAGIRTCWFNPTGKPRRPDIVPDCEASALGQIPALLEKFT